MNPKTVIMMTMTNILGSHKENVARTHLVSRRQTNGRVIRAAPLHALVRPSFHLRRFMVTRGCYKDAYRIV